MGTNDALTQAPWSEGEVAALNAWNTSGLYHPMTCGNTGHSTHQTLFAETDGWHCPDPDCSYTQNWALAFMLDPGLMERTRQTREAVWGASAYSMNSKGVLDKLHRTEAALRSAEDELAELRAMVASLTQQKRAMQIVLARVTQAQKAGLSPSVEQTAGDCDAVWLLGDTGGRPIEDVGTGEVL